MSTYPLGQCLYCGAVLNGSTKQEHIIPKGLGGSLTTSKVTCSRCNEKLGRDLDDPLTARFHPILNYLAPALRYSIKIPEIHAKIDGQRVTLDPGFRARQKVEMKRDSTGKPVWIKVPNRRVAEKIKRTLARPHESTYEEFMEERNDILKLTTDVSSQQLVRGCAKIILEYADHVSHSRNRGGDRSRFRQAAFSDIVAFIARNQVPPFLPSGKIYSFPAFRVDLDRLFNDNKCPESQFRHRVVICASRDTGQVMGIVDYFRGDIWGCLLADSYKGIDLTYLYQRSIIRNTQPSWYLEISSALANYRQLETVRPRFTVSHHHPISDRYNDIFHETVYYIEANHPRDFERELRFLIGKRGDVSADEIFRKVERRIRNYFYRNEAWESEWPRIRADALKRLRTKPPASEQDDIFNFGVELYRELLQRCKEHIGTVRILDTSAIRAI